jgi:hypothetical protein
MNSRSSDNDCFAFLLRFARSQFNRRLIAVSLASPISGLLALIIPAKGASPHHVRQAVISQVRRITIMVTRLTPPSFAITG